MKAWTDARDHCFNLNSHLVSINSNAENEFVKSMPEQSNNLVWIGIFSYDSEASLLRWTDGSSVSFTSWSAVSSPGIGNQDNYFCVSYDTISGLWLNGSCRNEHPFACKRKGR